MRHRDVVCGGESGIALVVRWHAHDGAGPVCPDDVVSLMDRQRFAGERMPDGGAGGWIAHRDSDERGRRHGVGPGGEHGQVAEVDLASLGPSDPLALQALGTLGPVQAVETVEQTFRVRRDAQEPLVHDSLDHRRPAALTHGAVVLGLLAG